MRVDCARVSTGDQTLDLKKDALTKAGCEQLLTDVLSGSKTARPGLTQALGYVRPADTLVVWRLDRLEGRGIGFMSLTESIDTTTPGGNLIFHIFGSLAEFERSLIRERTLAGLAAARARGRKGGRPKKQIELARRNVR